MTRRLITFIAITAMVFAMLPAGFAAASGTATASLDAASLQVFPEGRTVRVTVRNTDSGLFNGLVGATSINAIRILLPHGQGVTLSDNVADQNSFTATSIRRDTNQSVLFTGASLGGLQTATFDIPVAIARPLNADRTAPWVVQVSGDGGNSFANATGSLTQTIKILEVTNGTVLRGLANDGSALDPARAALAANGTATGGQRVAYGVTVKNWAQQAVTVAPNLTAAADTVNSSPPAAQVGGNDGTVTFPYDLTLGNVASGETTRNYAASAVKSDGSSPSASRSFTYTVQARPQLGYANNTWEPRYVKGPGAPDGPFSYVYAASFNKTGLPAIHSVGGQYSFADTVAPIASVTGEGPYRIATESTDALGGDGSHRVNFDFNIVDGNGFGFAQNVNPTSPLVTIDSLRPIIENLRVELPGSQIHAKNGDSITVRGTVRDANPDPNGISLSLVQNNGGSIPVLNITTSSTAGGLNFVGTVSPEFYAGTADSARASNFHVTAEATDLARIPSEQVDNRDTPTLIDWVTPCIDTANCLVTGQTTTEFQDNYRVSTFGLIVQVEEDLVSFGGCDTRNWSSPGSIIIDVLYGNGERCVDGTKDESNVRVLIIQGDRDRDFETTATYTPNPMLGSSSRVRDGAARTIAGTEHQEIRAFVAPVLELLDAVTRNGGTETATFDADRYWTRFNGNDLRIGVRTNVRTLDRLCVYANSTDSTPLVCSDEASGNGSLVEVHVPIGHVADAGQQAEAPVRYARLVNFRGVTSDALPIHVMVDRITPGFSSASRVGDQVEVKFSEIIHSGTDAAVHWFAQTIDNGDVYNVGVTRVNTVSGDRTVRRLDVDWSTGSGNLHAVEYDFASTGNSSQELFVDRAGNTVPAFVRITNVV